MNLNLIIITTLILVLSSELSGSMFLFSQHQMAYRRDASVNESIPLPIETVYNSVKDVITAKDEDGCEYYFRNGIEHFNRIYFKYPPKWMTSDIGEKIIEVCNMKISIRQRMQLEFVLYIRKYKKDKFDELAEGLYNDIDDLNDEQIQNVFNRMERDDCKVFRIEYINDIFDDIDDFINDLRTHIEDDNVYSKVLSDIYDSDQTKNENIAAYEQLDKVTN